MVSRERYDAMMSLLALVFPWMRLHGQPMYSAEVILARESVLSYPGRWCDTRVQYSI